VNPGSLYSSGKTPFVAVTDFVASDNYRRAGGEVPTKDRFAAPSSPTTQDGLWWHSISQCASHQAAYSEWRSTCEISAGDERSDDLRFCRSKVLIDLAAPYIVAGGTWQVALVHILWIFRSLAP